LGDEVVAEWNKDFALKKSVCVICGEKSEPEFLYCSMACSLRALRDSGQSVKTRESFTPLAPRPDFSKLTIEEREELYRIKLIVCRDVDKQMDVNRHPAEHIASFAKCFLPLIVLLASAIWCSAQRGTGANPVATMSISAVTRTNFTVTFSTGVTTGGNVWWNARLNAQ
jgi:hypothetical protein